jgi:hypothetical protein
MVKTHQKRFLKLKFSIIIKNTYSSFCQKNLQAMDETFLPILKNPWVLMMSGMGCYAQKSKKNTKFTVP